MYSEVVRGIWCLSHFRAAESRFESVCTHPFLPCSLLAPLLGSCPALHGAFPRESAHLNRRGGTRASRRHLWHNDINTEGPTLALPWGSMPEAGELFHQHAPVLGTSLARHGLVDLPSSPPSRRPSLEVRMAVIFLIHG